jgi:uncharacterized protein (TIGR03067 family)
MSFIAAMFLGMLTCCPAEPDDKEKIDAARLQGKWDWDQSEPQSDAEPKSALERIVIKDDTLTFHYRHIDPRSKEKTSTASTVFKLNPHTSPKQIDIIPTEGGNKGKTYHGIYEFENGRLKMCYRGPGASRPKNFDDKADGNAGTFFIYVKDNKPKQ